MIRKIIYFFVLANVFIGDVYGETISTMKIIDFLGSDNSEVVDKAIKHLGINQGISGEFKKFQMLKPWISESTNLFVLALSWDPPDGYVILLDSEGHVLSMEKIGYIQNIGLRQLLGGGEQDAIIVDVISGHGSGFSEKKIVIFGINNKSLFKVWEGITLLDDIYIQNKIIHGYIKFELNPENHTYDLIHNYRVEEYYYNYKTNDWMLKKTKKHTGVYVLKDNKYILKKTKK